MPPDTSQATSPFGNDTIDSLAGKIKAKYPAYNEMDNAELVRKTIQKYPVYQTHLSTEALQGIVNPGQNEPAKGFFGSMGDIGKGVYQFGKSLATNTTTPAQTPEDQAAVSVAKGMGIPAPLALGYKRTFFDPGQQAQQAASDAADAGKPWWDIVGHSAEAATSYAGPAGFAGPTAAASIFTPGIVGRAGTQAGQGNYAGAAGTFAAGVALPEAIKVGSELARGKTTTPAPVPEVVAPKQPAPGIETPQQAASTPNAIPAAAPTTIDYTQMSSGELARGFGGADHEARMQEMLRRQSAARSAQTTTPQDQFVNSLGLKSVGTQNGLVNFEHPSHPGLSSAVPIADGLDANAIRSAMANRLEEFGQDPAHNSPILQRNVEAIRNRLPQLVATQDNARGNAMAAIADMKMGNDPGMIAGVVQMPSDGPFAGKTLGEVLRQIPQGSNVLRQKVLAELQRGVASQQAPGAPAPFNMKAPDAAIRPDLGPEFDAGQRSRELDHAQSILNNTAASAEEKQDASQRLQELGGSAQSSARTGPLPDPTRINGSGDSAASQEALNRAAVLQSHGVSRIRIDTRSGRETTLLGADSVDAKAGPFDRIVTRGPNYETVLDEGAHARPLGAAKGIAPAIRPTETGMYDLGEINHSTGPNAIAEDTLPAPVSAIHNAPIPEPLKFDAEDFNMRKATDEKWQHQLDSKQITGRQADNYTRVLNKIRGGLETQVNDFIKGDPHGSEAHLDVSKEANRLRTQASAGRDVVTQDPLAKAMRGEMAVRPNRPWAPEFKLGRVDENNVYREITDPLPGALRDQFHQLLGDKTTTIPERIPEEVFNENVKTAAKAQMIDAKKALTTRMESLANESGDFSKVATADRLSQALRDEKLFNGRDLKSEVATLQSILGTGRERLRYTAKGSPVVDEQGVVRAAGTVQEKSIKWAQEFTGKKYLNEIPPDADLLRHADNLEKRANALDKIAKRLKDRQPETGAVSAASLGMASAGMATGAGIGHALAGTPGAIVGGALGFVAGAVLPELYKPALHVLDSLHNEIKGYGLDFLGGAKDVTKSVVNFLAPKVGVDGKSLDAIYAMKGDIAASMKAASNVLDVYRKHLDSLGTQGQIDFIDRYKSGQQQVTPELQALAETIKQIDKENHDKITLFKPNLPFLDNHFRLLYKTLPGAAGADGFEGWLGKRPLAGSRGFLQQHVYDTLSDAMANGGVPVTTNPVDLFLLGHADVQRFIHANMLWEWAKNEGVANFQKNGTKPTPGYVPLDDKIAKVYFPAASGEGNINPGAYRVQEGFGRLMNNYLSRDYIRENVLGKAIIDFKNVANGWSLIGGFHAVTVNAAALVQNMNIAGQRMYNLGIRQASGGDFAAGIRDLVKAPVELVMGQRPAFMEGKHLEAFGAAIDRYKRGDTGALKQFTNSDHGQKFLQKYPDAEALLGDAFQGGLNMRMSDDIRSNITKNMQQAFQDKKYLAAGARVPGVAVYEALNRPLFDNYIPRVKLGIFLRDMSQQLKDRAPEILNGSLTREELARKVVNRTENIFGEMNFDNMFWNKTLKTSLQLFYRSVTWRLGTMLAEGTGFVSQGKELAAAAKAGNLPRLDPNFGFVAGSIITLGLTSAVMQKIMSGKNPGSIADLTHPQTGDKNDLGRPDRLNVPGYGTEFLKLSTHPLDYAVSGRSGPIDQLVQSWQNKDFYGKQISNPNDSILKQFSMRALHALAPQIIINENMNRMKASGASKSEALLGMIGFSTASKKIDQTPAELKAQEIAIRGIPQAGRTAEQIAHSQMVTNIVTGSQNKRDMRGEISNGIKDQTLSDNDLDNIQKRLSTPFLTQKLTGNNIRLADVLSVYDLASPEEKRQLKPIVADKMDDLAKMNPAVRNQMIPRAVAALQGK